MFTVRAFLLDRLERFQADYLGDIFQAAKSNYPLHRVTISCLNVRNAKRYKKLVRYFKRSDFYEVHIVIWTPGRRQDDSWS